MAEFFGFEINRKGKKEPERVSFVPDTESDGAGVIKSGGHFGPVSYTHLTLPTIYSV